MEGSLLRIHFLHVLLSHLNLPTCVFDVLIVFVAVLLSVLALLFVLNLHILGACLQQASEDIKAVAGTSTAILDRGDPAHIRMTLNLLFFLEREILVKLCNIRDFLELVGVALYLLFQVLNALRYTLRNFKIMLNFLHGGADLGLLQCVLGQRLVRLFKLTDLLLFQINFGHFTMVIRQLLVVIVVCWLLVLFQFIDWRLALLLVIISAALV